MRPGRRSGRGIATPQPGSPGPKEARTLERAPGGLEGRTSAQSTNRPAIKEGISVRRLRWLVLALGLALAVRQWVWMPTLVVGESMTPTLRHGQFAGVNKLI